MNLYLFSPPVCIALPLSFPDLAVGRDHHGKGYLSHIKVGDVFALPGVIALASPRRCVSFPCYPVVRVLLGFHRLRSRAAYDVGLSP